MEFLHDASSRVHSRIEYVAFTFSYEGKLFVFKAPFKIKRFNKTKGQYILYKIRVEYSCDFLYIEVSPTFSE